MLPFHDGPVIRENIIAKILFASCLEKISYRKISAYTVLKKLLCGYIFGNIPYNQNYWQALYLVIYSKNVIDGILNWQL